MKINGGPRVELVGVLLVALLGGCGGSTTTPQVPTNHRAVDATCSPTPVTSPPPCPANGDCSNNADCSSGTNGRCVEVGFAVANCSCTYDTCATDSDCAAGTLCACNGSAFLGSSGNSCVAGNCRVDSDCGAHGYCSPSVDAHSCGGLGGYYCHTSSDQCANDGDCHGTVTSGDEICAYITADKRWECVAELFCA